MYMYAWLNLVKMVIYLLSFAISIGEKYIDFDKIMKQHVLDIAFCKQLTAIEIFLWLICAAIRHLEGDASTFSYIWTCFLLIDHDSQCISLKGVLGLQEYYHLSLPYQGACRVASSYD